MFVFFEIGTSVVECALTHLLFDAWYGRRSASRRRLLGGLTIYFLVNCSYTLMPILPIVRTLCAAACFYVVCLLVYNSTPTTAIVGAMVNLAINVLVEYLTLVVMDFLVFDTNQLMNYGPERVSYIVIAKLLNIIVILLVASILGHHKVRLSIVQVIPLLICQLISIYICQVFYQAMERTSELQISFILALMGLLYINIVMILFVENLTIAEKAKQEKALAEQNYALQRAYYEEVQKDQANTHALWHDIKKYVLAIEAVTTAGDDVALQQNIAFIKDSFARTGNLVDVGNQEANVILNHCIQKARAHDIQVRIDVSIPETLGVSAVDLSVIIGNTFDNAIEECQRLETKNRIIVVELKQKNDMLVYAINNPCLEQAVKKRGYAHGYGLSNIRNCIAKYDGTLKTEKDDSHYQVVVRLNTSKETVAGV